VRRPRIEPETCASRSRPPLAEGLTRAIRGPRSRRELYAALDNDVPIILVHEADEGKGGAPLDDLKAECREHCRAGTLRRAFAGETGGEIRWVRAQEFQLVSLKQMGRAILRQTPLYKEAQRLLLDKGLFIPGEVPPMFFSERVRLAVCPQNRGAAELAAELQATDTAPTPPPIPLSSARVSSPPHPPTPSAALQGAAVALQHQLAYDVVHVTASDFAASSERSGSSCAKQARARD
jgi:hypothetical protein